ncbi:MAG: lipid-binding SYLF domain-containing protein [Planctomycetota bacterium]
MLRFTATGNGRFVAFWIVLVGSLGSPRFGLAQNQEAATIEAASLVLSETISKPLGRVPAAMLKDCHGVAIIPNVIKGSFIVGARRGHGLLFVRDPDGTWHAPVFVTLTGGNVGWQVGVQASDLILVFKTSRSVQGILSGKLTLGGDAAAAAGPVGRQAAVATDGRLQAEIYTYSRSRGLFAGVSIDGSVLTVDPLANGMYYRSPAPGQPVFIPPAAMQLTQAVASYAGHAAEGIAAGDHAKYAQQNRLERPEIVQQQLLAIAPDLFRILDPEWQHYLALPLNPGSGNRLDASAIEQTLAKYDRVASDPQFAILASRPEFRSVHSVLKHLESALIPQGVTMNLPPPPAY